MRKPGESHIKKNMRKHLKKADERKAFSEKAPGESST